MAWTITDDDEDVIQVRASIDVKAQSHELRELVLALVRRQPEIAKTIIEHKETFQ